MAVSHACKILLVTGIVFVILSHCNLGLLSDYKICGDSECESLMSRVQAIRDHHGKDCRFLSFKRGETIFVYHKLTGKREDLWAGSIDKEFCHFPKDAVKEEQVFATIEKVVETQKSDFFCIDESGYPIDSSQLDSDDGEDDDEKTQNQESETTPAPPFSDHTTADSPSTSEDVSTEPPVSAQEADGTSKEEDESKNASDAAVGTHKEENDAPVAPNEQGGSASSPGLSSVTGWLGLATEEEPGSLAEGEKKDESKETQAKASFTSSVTGWLGFGGEEQSENDVKNREEDGETSDSFTSSMGGWLGFGSEKKTDHSAEKEHNEERENDEEQEPQEKFRSRRMSLDLEGSRLHEEEKTEMGTLDWLGNGLTSTLGFRLTNQESGHETATAGEAEETIQGEGEQPSSNSWFDMGIGGILGFGKDKREVAESRGNGFEETEEDKTSEKPTSSDIVVTSQQQPSMIDELRREHSNESKMEETPGDHNVPSEIETVTDSKINNNKGTSDSSKDGDLPKETASEVNQEDISSQAKLEENPQALSSKFNSIFQTGSSEEEEKNIIDDNNKVTNVQDGERSAELVGKDNQMPKSIEHVGENNYVKPGEEEIKTATHFLARSDINLGPDINSVDLNSNSTGQSVGKKGITEEVDEVRAEIQNKIDSREESTDTSVKIGASSEDHESEGNKADTDALHRGISEIQTEQIQVSGSVVESGGESQTFLPSGTAKERSEPVSNEDDTALSEITSVDHSDTLAMTDNNTEAETHQGEKGQEGKEQPIEGNSPELSHSSNRSMGIVSENASEKDRETFSNYESRAKMQEDADQDAVAPHMQQSDGEANRLKETERESWKGAETGADEGSKEEEKQVKKLKELQEVEEINTRQGVEEEKQEGVEELKEEKKQQELKEINEVWKQEDAEELRDEKRQEGIGEFKEKVLEEIKKEDNQEDVGEVKGEVVEEIQEGENQEEVGELKGEKKQGEEVELKEEEKQQEVKEIHGVGKQEDVEELRHEKRQERIGELKEEVMEEIKEEDNQEVKGEQKLREEDELKEEEKQQEVKEIHGVGKQEDVEELRHEKRQERIGELKEEVMEEIKEEDNQEVKGEQKLREEDELKEEEKKVEIEEVKEKEIQEEVEELGGEEKQEAVEELRENKKQEVIEELKGEEGRENLMEEKEEKREEEKKKQAAVEEVKDEIKEEGAEGLKADENAERERTDKEKEESLKCSNEYCSQISEDGSVRDSDGNNSENRLSSVDEGGIETEEPNATVDNDQILPDRKGLSQTLPSEGMEREEDRKQEEEKRNDRAEADEGTDEQGEEKNSESNIAVNEDIKSNKASSISDLNAFGANQIGKSDYTDGDQPFSVESDIPNTISTGQTAENKEDDHLYQGEAKNTDHSDDNVLHQGPKTKPEDTDISSNDISSEEKLEHKTETEKHTDREEKGINVKHDDMRVNEDANTSGTEFRTEEGDDGSVSFSDPVESQVVISQQTVPDLSQNPAGSSLLSDGHNKGMAETESGAFGLFKNAFSYFKQKTVTESIESAPSLDSNTGETSEVHVSLTPEQELEPALDSTQVFIQDLHTDSPITLSRQQAQPSPPPFSQTSFPSSPQTLSHHNSPSPNTRSPLQTKTVSKQYKNLLTYMTVDDTTMLTEFLGRHKLQFLDFILGSSETMRDDPDNDESILSDIERLLHYHREKLVAPRMRLGDAPHGDEEKTRTLIALQKLEVLLARVRETFNTGKSGISNTNHQAEASKDKEIATEEESSYMNDTSVGTPRGEWMGVDDEKDGQLNGGTGKEGVNEAERRGEKEKRSEEERVPPESPPQVELLEGQILDFVHQMTTHVYAVRELLMWLAIQVVSSLPDDIRPGPDLYGVPWEPVIISSLVGLMTVLLFTCRCYRSVKSRMYRSKERWMAEQVAQLLDEKCKVLETLSSSQQEYDDLENSLRDSGVLAQTQKTEHLEGKARQLVLAKKELERDLKQLKDELDQQREHRIEQERRIAVLEESMKTFEEETKDLQSQDEQAQTTLKVYNMNSDRLQRNLETAGEEKTLLQESNAQLRQQVEGWAERVSELEAEMSRCELAHSGMLQDVANKDERIMSLTDRLLSMKAWDSDLEEGEEGGEKEASNGTAGEENGKEHKGDTQSHLQKVQKLIYAAKLNADLKSVDEDKDRAFGKLNDEVKAKEDLSVSIKELESEKLSLQSDTEHYSEQVQRLQQKLQIMTEMYQENELKLHRMLTVEEKERMQKEEKLNKADKNIAMAMEELNNYRQRAEDMEEELEKTKQSYQTQISAHEKKAHNNWLAARAADRELADIRRENALFRQKLTDTQFKLDALDKDPYALNSLARPLPFRAERSPYGPSPLGRPSSETRAFLSPPTLMDGPPARLSPRVPRGPVETTGGQGEMELSGPHSDSGSNSPTWERDRRGPPPGPPGPLGPPGYMFPEQVGPMYRRPPPPPGAMGHVPAPGPYPPGTIHPRGHPPPHRNFVDLSDGPHRDNSYASFEPERRESGTGDRRTPPEADPRMVGAPPPGALMGPMDGPFPRRAPYGPPPPDFYPPRGPGGPPMMPMWAPPPPGMMYPPRFPPAGAPLPPASHSHHAPPMRPPLPDGVPPPSMGPLPPQQSLPSPPHSQSPQENTPSPEDAI